MTLPYKIAVSLSGSYQDVVSDQSQAIQSGATHLEYRLDLIDPAHHQEIFSNLFKNYGVRVRNIATVRHPEEAGNARQLFVGTENERAELLQRAIDAGEHYIDFVDYELRHPLKLRKEETKLIVSYHDFNQTPDFLQLNDIYEAAVDRGADIVKIATRANHPRDSRRMLDLITLMSDREIPLIGICMGELGKITRIEGPRLGSFLTFAKPSGSQGTADGQLTIDELRTQWNALSFAH